MSEDQKRHLKQSTNSIHKSHIQNNYTKLPHHKLLQQDDQIPIKYQSNNEEDPSQWMEEIDGVKDAVQQIIDIFREELDIVDSKNLFNTLISILEAFKSDIASQIDQKDQGLSRFVEILNTNFSKISDFFANLLNWFDNAKTDSLGSWEQCLEQLIPQIIKEVLKANIPTGNINTQNQWKNSYNAQQKIMKTQYDIFISRDQSFVQSVNKLSDIIKQYIKGTKDTIKAWLNNNNEITNSIKHWKQFVHEVQEQTQAHNFTMTNLNAIKDAAELNINNINNWIMFNKNTLSNAKAIESFNVEFFGSAKRVFKQLRLMHNEKIEELKKINATPQLTLNSTMTEGKMFEKMKVGNTHIRKVGEQTKNNMLRKNQSVSPTRKRIATDVLNTNNSITNIHRGNNRNLSSKSKNSVKKKIENPQLNISTSNTSITFKKIDSISTAAKSTMNTTNNMNTSGNIPRGGNTVLLSELNEKNKELTEKMEVMVMENKKWKQQFSNLKQIYEKTISDGNSMPKNTQQKDTSTLFSNLNPNTVTVYDLSNEIVSWLTNMNELQSMIVKKHPNVSEKKKQFEKQKYELKNVANIIKDNHNINNRENLDNNNYNTQPNHDQGKVKSDKLKNEIVTLKESLEKYIIKSNEYEKIIQGMDEEIRTKNQEISRLTLECNKSAENKKGSAVNQAKLKDFENKLISLKSENETWKNTLKGNEEQINGLKEEIESKNNIIAMPKQDTKWNEMLNENEKLQVLLDEMKTANNNYQRQIDELSSNKAVKDQQFNKLKHDKDELEAKCKAITDELEKKKAENSEFENRLSSLDNENKNNLSKISVLERENKINVNKISGLEKENKLNQSKINTMEKDNKVSWSKLSLQKDNEIKEIKSRLEALSKSQGEKTENKNILNELRSKVVENEIEISDLKMKRKLQTKQAVSPSQIINKEGPSANNTCGKEFIEISNMIKNIHSLLNTKHKEFRLQLSSNEIRISPNDAFFIYEDNDNQEEDSILSSVNDHRNYLAKSSPKEWSPEQISSTMEKVNSYYTEINQIIPMIFSLAKKSNKSGVDNDNKLSKHSGHIKPNIQDEISNNDANKMMNSKTTNKIIAQWKDENTFLKSFFKECTRTIFESIKQIAPDMIDEESEISFNIISGNAAPGNQMDSPLSPQKQSLPELDKDFISSAVEKFKEYNNEVNEQIKKLMEDKEELEKTAHNNQVMASAYKAALDNAISKITNNDNNNNNEDIPQLNNNKNMINIRDEARTFTVEDLENPQSENNILCSINNKNQKDKENKSPIIPQSKLSKISLSSDLKKVNSDLMAIQADWWKKNEEKDEEIEKYKKIVNDFLWNKLSNQKNNSSNIDNIQKRYEQLVEWYTSEQNKNNELRSSYYSFINEFTDFVQRGDKLNKNEWTLRNEGIEIENENENLEADISIEDDDEDLSPENWKELQYEKERKGNMKMNKNKTVGKITNMNKLDYIGMLNEGDNMNNSMTNPGVNEWQIQELLNENKNLEEQEEWLMTQLTTVKSEWKETRAELNKTIEDNMKLKMSLSEKVNISKEEIVAPLRNAIERWIFEIQLTPKVKEFLKVIMLILGYTEEQITMIYQMKEKKKGFLNMFK